MDLVKSTQHWLKEPQIMRSKLARFEDIVKNTLDNKGMIVKTIGDAVMCIIEGDAVECLLLCLDIQSQLVEEKWEGHPFYFRMGLCFGEV